MKSILSIFIVLYCISVLARENSTGGSPLVELANMLSSDDSGVAEEVKLYTDNPEEYFRKFEGPLQERWIESASDITKEIVLIDALMRANKIAYFDVASEPGWTVSKIDALSQGKISKNICYSEMISAFENTKYGVGTFLQQQGYGPSIKKCVEASGFKLLGIDEGSDSYAITVVDSSSESRLSELLAESGIKTVKFI